MKTRATVEGKRVTVWRGKSGRWRWTGDEFGDMVGGFNSLEACLADAQNIFGADVRIVRHTAAEPQGATLTVEGAKR